MFFNNVIEVGQGFGKKSLPKALEMAKKDSIILIHPGHYIEPKKFTVKENLTIKSYSENAESVVLNCAFVVLEGVKFKIENISIECETEDTFIHGYANSIVEIENCTLRDAKNFVKNEQGKYRVFAYKSILNIKNSNISAINNIEAAIGYDNAKGNIIDSTIQGIWAKNTSDVFMSNNKTSIGIVGENNSIILAKGFMLVDVDDSKYSFMAMNNSQLFLEEIVATKNLNMHAFASDSYIKIASFKPQQNEKFDIIYNMQSSIEGDLDHIKLLLKDENMRVVEQEKDQNKEEEEKPLFIFDDVDKEKVEEKEEKVDYLEELEKLYGIEKVKNKVREFVSIASINKKREEMGYKGNNISFHSVFLGNPGTGKTTVARLLGKLLYQYGVIKKDVFVEVAREDLVAEYVGQTAPKTKEVLERALGGILFIDEAYTLYSSSGNDFGKECVDTILKFMEDKKSEIMIIFAGYTNEMRNFLNMNPGLKSRVPNEFEFEDYSPTDLANIGYTALVEQGYIVDEEFYKKNLSLKYTKDIDKSNARFARNFNEQILLKQALRISTKENPEKYMNTIENEDINAVVGGDTNSKEEKINKLIEELNSMIGLENVKEYVEKLLKQAKSDKKLKELNLNQGSESSYHMLFTGNPGTGKTTIARIIAEIFYNLDILTNKNVLEVSRPDLVGGYIGHTEIKTKEAITSAMGGVLFIDEAYQLSNTGNSNDFGKEAIETLITSLENYRTKFIAIFAGYSKNMEEFLDVNPGLRSRIPITIEFPDYTPQEIGKIVKLNLTKKWNIGNYPIEEKIAKVYTTLDEKDKSNARWARNISEEIIRNHKIWLVDNDNCDDITTIREEILESTIMSKIN